MVRPDASRIRPGDIILSGYLSDVNGIGRAGRLTEHALSEWPAQVLTHDLRDDNRGSRVAAATTSGGIWLCHCNPPEVLHFLTTGDPRIWRHRYRIGYWAYELQVIPESWMPAISFFHEIWAPSQFVANAIIAARRDNSTLVRVVPHPLPEYRGITSNRTKFDTAGRFAFLAMFDTRSTAARKNPFGAVKAFQAAFSAEDSDVLLIVKVVFAADDRGTMARLKQMTSAWPNIRLVTEHLTDRETLELMASIDCHISLHRSEGFGLTIAEAMWLGIPVIATNWSAPVEFAEGAAILVPYTLVTAIDENGRYGIAGEVWADPDLDFAARAMRRLRADTSYRQTLGSTARRQVIERLGNPILPDRHQQYLRRERRRQMAAE